MAPAEFTGRLRSASPLFLRGTERPGLLQDVLRGLDDTNRRLDHEREEFTKEFERTANEAARGLLDRSKETIEAELKRLGITGEMVSTPDGATFPNFSLSATATAAAMKQAAGALVARGQDRRRDRTSLLMAGISVAAGIAGAGLALYQVGQEINGVQPRRRRPTRRTSTRQRPSRDSDRRRDAAGAGLRDGPRRRLRRRRRVQGARRDRQGQPRPATSSPRFGSRRSPTPRASAGQPSQRSSATPSAGLSGAAIEEVARTTAASGASRGDVIRKMLKGVSEQSQFQQGDRGRGEAHGARPGPNSRYGPRDDPQGPDPGLQRGAR